MAPILSEKRNLNKWIHDMKQPQMPADDIALAVLAEQFACTICVIQKGGKIWQSEGGRVKSVMRRALFIFLQTPTHLQLCLPKQEGGWVWKFLQVKPPSADVYVADHDNFPRAEGFEGVTWEKIDSGKNLELQFIARIRDDKSECGGDWSCC